MPSLSMWQCLGLVLLLSPFLSSARSSSSIVDSIFSDTNNDALSSVVIGLSFRNDVDLPPHPVTADLTKSNVLVMTCHSASAEKASSAAETLATPAQCCSAMIRAASASKEKDELPALWASMLSEIITPEDPSAASSAHSRCETEGSIVPKPPDYASKNGSHSLRFAFYVTTSTNLLSDREEGGTLTNNMYIWNDLEQLGVWLDDLSLEATLPSWLKHFAASMHTDRLADSTSPTNGGIPVDFRSVLSQSGGMHRSFDHTLAISLEDMKTIWLSQTNYDERDSSKIIESMSLEASFLLLIPSGMFMDAEDAFDQLRSSITITVPNMTDGSFDDQNSDNILLTRKTTSVVGSDDDQKDGSPNLSLYTERIIDIEQPAFDSPQHAVLMTLKWTATSTDNTANTDGQIAVLGRALNDRRMDDASLVFRFGAKIHLRYPSPVDTESFSDNIDGLPSSLYEPVLLPPPTWVSGQVSCKTQKPSSRQTLQLYGSSPWHLFGYEPTLVASTYGGISTRTTATWVAAAPKDDFVAVAVFTVLFSLLGAIMLGYEISKIS